MNAEAKAALEGQEVRVDANSIEQSLSEMWRAEGDASQEAVMRAALWNVIAHTDAFDRKNMASEILAQVSVRVPQRTIVIRASAAEPAEMTSWISANCHVVGGEKQICSEEISIVAGGDRIYNVPSLVQALLLPDMPVAAWWVGDLPDDHAYVNALLRPVDRLIVDSRQFDSPDDLLLVAKIANETHTAPADLNWARLEEWRTATASVFDHPDMRGHLAEIASIRIVSSNGSALFGESTEAYFFASWIGSQLKRAVGGDAATAESLPLELVQQKSESESGSLLFVELRFRSGSTVHVELTPDGAAISTNYRGSQAPLASVTRLSDRQTTNLVTRQLAQREDAIYRRVLPLAAALAKRMRQ